MGQVTKMASKNADESYKKRLNELVKDKKK
jgi:hypothetical protein